MDKSVVTAVEIGTISMATKTVISVLKAVASVKIHRVF